MPLTLRILKSGGVEEPEKEYRFHPVRKWRFDYAWVKRRVALEIDGAVYTRGGHTRGKGYTNNREKDAEALCLGWRVLRVTTGQVESGEALRWLWVLLVEEVD